MNFQPKVLVDGQVLPVLTTEYKNGTLIKVTTEKGEHKNIDLIFPNNPLYNKNMPSESKLSEINQRLQEKYPQFIFEFKMSRYITEILLVNPSKEQFVLEENDRITHLIDYLNSIDVPCRAVYSENMKANYIVLDY